MTCAVRSSLNFTSPGMRMKVSSLTGLKQACSAISADAIWASLKDTAWFPALSRCSS
ncbi:hypothetical protein LP420_41215 [Massilia sp. B-10]|nr:hypothetical protein LP420_41215 [Massilia sp. B-10]